MRYRDYFLAKISGKIPQKKRNSEFCFDSVLIADHFPSQYTVTGQDRHKGPLAFRLSFVQNQNKLLMDFRLSKGDGLEFKRIFAILRQKLDHIIAEDPVAWSNVTSKKVEV
jgi:hypothetical protein